MADATQPDPTNAYQRLKQKQRRFVDALCKFKSQTDAAREAGYGAKRPENAAHRLMRDPLVRMAYEQRREQLAREAGVDGVRVLHEIAEIGFNKKVGKNPRLKALELLGKNLKLWTEKHEHSLLPPPTLNITFPDGGPGIGKTPTASDDGVEKS